MLPKGEGIEEKPQPLMDQREKDLKNLKVPSNFPKILKLFFGSQSGTAEKLCQILMDEAKILGVFDNIEVINFEDFDAKTFGKSKEVLNIMCVATHYEGEPCDNTARFY